MAAISLLAGKRSKGRGAQRRRSDKPRMQLLLEAEGAEEEEEEGGLPMIARFPLPAHGKLQSKDAVGVSGTIIAGELGCIIPRVPAMVVRTACWTSRRCSAWTR